MFLFLPMLSCGSLDPQDGAGPNAADAAPEFASKEVVREAHEAEFAVLANTALHHHASAQTEAAIAACMALDGFDYEIPPEASFLLPAKEMADTFRDASQQNPLDETYRGEFGYGYTTLRAYLTVDRAPDPNQIALASMSDDAAEDYLVAMIGEEGARAAWNGEVATSSGGCVGEATKSDDTEFEDLSGVLEMQDEIRERIIASADYVVAERNWASCASDKGYDFQSHADIESWLAERLDSIDQNQIELAEPNGEKADVVERDEVGSEDEVGSLTVEEGDQEWEPPVGSPYDPQELEALQQEEISVALNLRSCDVAFAEEIEPLESQVAQDLLSKEPTAS